MSIGAVDDRTADSESGRAHRTHRRDPFGSEGGEVVAVRRNILLSGVIGALAGLIGLAFLARGSWVLDAPLGLLLVLLSALHLAGLASWRVPVLLADEQGIRLRIGLAWRGLPWSSVRQIVVEHADSPLREGRLVVVPRDFSGTAAGLDPLAQLHLRWNRAWYGSNLAVPLGITTLTDSADLAGDLRALSAGAVDIADMRGRKLANLDEVPARPQAVGPQPAEGDAVALLPTALAVGTAAVLPAVVEPTGDEDPEEDEGPGGWFDDEPDDQPDEPDGPVAAAEPVFDAAPAEEAEAFAPFTVAPYLVDLEDLNDEPVVVPFEEGAGEDAGEAAPYEARDEAPYEAPDPWRLSLVADDAEFDELPPPPEDDLPAPVLPLRDVRRAVRAEVRLDRPAPVEEAAEDGAATGAEVPSQRGPGEIAAMLAGAEVTHLPRIELPAPVPTPIIGTKIAHAREMLDMSIEELSQRTRIRPHVLEAMEVDDFGPCGGDVYARGHLTSVARILGLTLEPLMAVFDERHAQGPINARRVFEAELSTGTAGGMRAAFAGPRWSLLISAVLCLTMIWGLARLFTGDPEQLTAAPDAGEVAVQTANRKPITSPMMKTTAMSVTASHAPAHVVVRDRTGKILWSGDLGLGRHRKIVGLAPFKVESDNAGAVVVSVKNRPLGAVGTAGEPGFKYFG